MWCGFNSNKLKIDDNYVCEQLVKLEKKLGRPIVRTDITIDNCGFSSIVVNRIFGNLNNAKKQLGLIDTPQYQGKSLNYYKKKLDYVLYSIEKETHRKTISWKDIENPIYNLNGEASEHKSYIKAFKRNGEDVFAYIQSKGFEPANNYISFRNVIRD